MHGIINIYKPSGISSNYCLTILKKNLGIKKIGHLGTLDPLACGVLPVMINKGTKLFDYYLNKNKTYRAIFTFTKQTDTLDSEGKVILEKEKIPSKEELIEAGKKLIGEIDQIPPVYSAKNINGERAYDLARKGEMPKLQAKKVKIYSLDLIKQINKTSFLYEIKCSSGTYIRSIARDLGLLTNSCAFMSALIRVNSGDFNILNSTFVKNLTKNNIADKIKSLDELFVNNEKIYLDASYYKAITNGALVKIKHKDAENIIVYCNDNLIGIGCIFNNIIKIKTNLMG